MRGLRRSEAARTRLDPRRVAAIMAAVAAFSDSRAEDLRIVSAIPLGPAAVGESSSVNGWPNLWALAGRQAQMAARAAARSRRG